MPDFNCALSSVVERAMIVIRFVTKNGGAWIKKAADEARMIDAMRKGTDLTIKGTSGGSMQSTDQYSLKGLAQVLDRAERECR
jgi:invasion protein IalB